MKNLDLREYEFSNDDDYISPKELELRRGWLDFRQRIISSFPRKPTYLPRGYSNRFPPSLDDPHLFDKDYQRLII